ncbi:hypothetical protein CMO91_04895 [Candidatus Woesearchaeota archaeon]|jgi:8-oxo-dGTP diphosphatase|nr:hypothetical protein [Candidatus Woesearchaeota archaeon]|tara:strand:- start:201 stop:617 length:417 start_codon:yes stop_codon:yes gene_type:complete
MAKGGRLPYPATAVDVVVEVAGGIVLIRRGNPPFQGQWALPGGFQEAGDSLEKTARKEMQEELNLEIYELTPMAIYSDPDRDPRGHVNSMGYYARAKGQPKAGDDAAHAEVFPVNALPSPLAFDHDRRVEEYRQCRNL